MSIFKVKQWWSNGALQNEQSNEGIQNANCLKVDKFNSYPDNDCILVGEESLLKVYKPEGESSQVLLESQLSDIILQIETGKFTAGAEDRQIIVLHPQNYEVFYLKRKDGHIEAGNQNFLAPVIKHSFTRKADSLTYGPFGNIKTRDFICILGLDGSLSFFDQDAFLFMCIFNDVIIPSPVAYIPSSDSFVICKSTWVLEIYSYQQLREFSELNVRQNKKNIPQWVYNSGEEISRIQVIQTSNNFSSIVALGERHLYCFQDNGLMKFMIKFDFMPICFYAYLIGWYYEPGARQLIMVTSDDSKLFIYEGTTLLWSCSLLTPAISISRCFLKSLPGGLVTLSNKGVVNVGYLSTEPDLNSNAPPMINDVTDPEQVQAELEVVEESLRKILNNNEDAGNQRSIVEQILKIKADVGKPVQNLFQEFTGDNDEALHLLMCPVIVILTCEEPNFIKSVQVTYVCSSPFSCSEPTICLDSINGTEIIENQVFLTSEADITESRVKIILTVTDTSGKIIVMSRRVLLPLSLYCTPVQNPAESHLKLRIETNHSCLEFSKIFTDFSEEELTKFGNNLTFVYRSTKKYITLKTDVEQYSIEAEDFTEMISILDHFLIRITDHYKRMAVKDFRFKLKYDKEFIKQLTHRFLKCVETHAKERIKLKDLEDELNVLQKQFTVVQKRLLVQYGSLPPGDCEPLEFLMKDTHKRLIKVVYGIIKCKETVCRAGSAMTAVGNLVIYLLKQCPRDDLKVTLIEEMMCLSSLYEHYQEWEEAVTQALSYILNNVFKKSEKDKEKLAPVTEQGILSHINLKRFIKQLRMVLEKMFSEIDDEPEKEAQVTRIEEFVEVL
ncbi:Bardet-Biedl syndrome 9 [Anticarsia gemmatalis]|uniref:Bardet-Biedl syndrome 9 n=1 Tax=Anticarsia gemmatalis TaxID=129554 RepID=UPI003F75B632